MSEEKLYAVKNDEGKYWDFLYSDGFWPLGTSQCPTMTSKEWAERVANYSGHVVTFVEEPEKVTVSPNEAQAIESLLNANTYVDVYDPFKYLFTSRYKKDIKRLIEAIKNGYTVAKEKKYNVKDPHVPLYYWKKPNGGLGVDDLNVVTSDDDTDDFEFTEAEIEQYSLQDCEKEEVTDDEEV